MSNWKKNTGVVPEEVTADTPVWVKYSFGETVLWQTGQVLANNDPALWSLEGFSVDVVEYSLEPPEEENEN